MNSDPTIPQDLQMALERANLLCVRKQFDDARALLLALRAHYPGNADVEYLLGRIAATDTVTQEEETQARQLRYSFGLQTTWRRFGWWCGAAILALYGACNAVLGFAEGFSQGMSTLITTQVYHSGGRYSPGYYTNWTRPAYLDVLYGLAFLLVGLGMAAIVLRASRGAAQWEELDGPVDDGSGSGWFPRWWGW